MHETTVTTPARRRGPLGWLLAPATDAVPRHQAVGAVVLRLVLGLLWAYNVGWKRPPDFGQEAGNGLFRFTSEAVPHPVLPPFSYLVENLVLPNFQVFGVGVLLAETALAVLLLTGWQVRLVALLGVAQSLAIGFSVAYAPNEWPWSYWLMVVAHLALLFSSSGRYAAVDAVRARLSDGRLLATVWGAAAIVAGLYSAITSAGDPLGAGTGYRDSAPSLTTGTYNLVGGLVLVAAGVLLVLGARARTPVPAVAAGGLTILAAVALDVQLAASASPLVGGNTTSAAYLLCLAVIALTLAGVVRRGPERAGTDPDDRSTRPTTEEVPA